MNIIARKLSTHLIFSFPSFGRRLIHLQPITALQLCSFYSTRAPRTSSKCQLITKPGIQKSSESPPSFTQGIKKQKEAQATVWPKPSEIPFQAKVANFVNLIGYVKIPVQFESDTDGKHFAATMISLGGGGERNHLLIPVVFKGDLAHIVACHVKENDCVFVSGKLRMDPSRLVLFENPGKFHVVAENLNFVEGFQKSALDKKIWVSSSQDGVDNDVNSDQLSIESPAKTLAEVALELGILEHGNVELSPEKGSNMIGESVGKKKDADQIWDLWRDLVKNPLQWWDYREHKTNGLVKEKYPDFKKKGSGESLWITSAPNWVLPGLGNLECDVKNLKLKQLQGGENPNVIQNEKLEDSWNNLVENPNKWWDNRANKRNPKAPDFVENPGKFHVVAENLNFVEGFQKSALDKKIGVLSSEEKLDSVDNDVNSDQISIESPAKPENELQEGGIKITMRKYAKVVKLGILEHGNVELSPEKGSNMSGENVGKKKDADQIWDLWRDLVKNPLQWWDYRKHKTNGLVKEKFPDFKKKGSGEPLWITSAPNWVLPGLGNLECDVENLKLKQVQGGENPNEKIQNGKLEDSWNNLVENPNKWWDNRTNKRNPKAPDFKHKETGEALWLDRSPAWALFKLPPM